MSTVAEQEDVRVAFRDDGTVAVAGALTFDTVPRVFEQSTAWLERPGGPISIDLREVSRADSAGLALLVEWLRLAKTKGRSLKFVNAPEQVKSLIRVNGLDRALGVES